MGPIEKSINAKLEDAYQPVLIDIENESNKHSAPLGTESHFKVILVSDKFIDQKRIDRSRNIHQLLEDEIKNIHALSLKLFTQTEWQNLTNKDILLSPNCKSKI